MSRTVKTDIPGPDRRVSVEEVREKGFDALFAPDLLPPLRLVVEIGFGRGEFLRQLAAEAPEVAHLGVEQSFKRVLKMARRIARGDERNLRLICAPGEEVIREAIAPESVAAFWINFSDPWPKKRHHARRLIQPGLVRQLAHRLTPGGVLQIATDHGGYAEHIDEVLRAETLLVNANAPAPFLRDVPGRMRTAYEEMWRAEGRELHFWTYRRPGAGPGDGSAGEGQAP